MPKRVRCSSSESLDDITKRMRTFTLNLHDYTTYPMDLQEWVSSHFGMGRIAMRPPNYLTTEEMTVLYGLIEQHKITLLQARRVEMKLDLTKKENWPEDMLEWYSGMVRNGENDMDEDENLQDPSYLFTEEIEYYKREAAKRREYLRRAYPVA